MEQEQMEKQPWQVKQDNYRAIEKFYSDQIKIAEDSKDKAEKPEEIETKRKRVDKLKGELSFFADAVDKAERSMEEYAENMKYYTILGDIISDLTGLNLEDKKVNKVIDDVKNNLNYESNQYTNLVRQSMEELVSLFDEPKNKWFGKKKIDNLPELHRSNIIKETNLDKIRRWVKNWKLTNNIDVGKVILTLENNISIKEYDKNSKAPNTKDVYTLDAEGILATISAYKDLDSKFKANLSTEDIRKIKDDVKSLDKLLFASKKIEELKSKIENYSESFKSGNLDFDPEKIITSLDDILGYIREKTISARDKVDKNMDVIMKSVQDSNDYKNAYNKYESLYKEYARLAERDPFSLTEEERQKMQAIELELKNLKETYNLDIKGMEDIIKSGIRDNYTQNKMDDLGVSQKMEGTFDDFVTKFSQEYPQEFEEIKSIVDERLKSESQRGDFGLMINASFDTTNKEYNEKYEKRKKELIEKAINEYLNKKERKERNEENLEKTLEENKGYSVYFDFAVSLLNGSGKLSMDSVSNLNPAEEMEVLNMCKHYASMSDMSPEERAIYMGTYMTPKGTNSSIELKSDGTMKNRQELSKQEEIAFRANLQFVQRHPEVYNMDDEYKRMQQSKKI